MTYKADRLRVLAAALNNNPVDLPTDDWGPVNLSSSYIADRINDRVSQHKKLFRRKKLTYEDGLLLYIYSYPSYHLFELIRGDSLLKECRGLIMSPLGVRNRPFPVIPTIDWEEAVKRAQNQVATVKINGVMLTGLSVKNEVIIIGKGGGEVECDATSRQRMSDLICETDILGLTPIFEYTDSNRPLVLKEESGCYLVGLRSIRTGRMAEAADLINIAEDYGLMPLSIVSDKTMLEQADSIEGVVFNDGNTIVRSKTNNFRKLQRITSILRYGRNGDLRELIGEVDRQSLQYNLTTRELDDLKRRQLL